MATLTEVVASVVIHSSAAAFSHFGMTLDAPRAEPAAATSDTRVVARTRPAPAPAARVLKSAACAPEAGAHLAKA